MTYTTYIEDIQKDIQEEISFIAEDISITFKRKYVYVVFFFNEGTQSKTNKFLKKNFKAFLLGCRGSAHSVMREHEFADEMK